MRVAVIDDFLKIALKTADWSAVQTKAEVAVFTDHLADPDKLIAELESAIVSASAARDTLFMDINSTRAITYADLAHLPDDARYGLSILN